MLAFRQVVFKSRMNIRLAQESDLAAAAALWYERIALLRQTDAYFTPLPNAMQVWKQQAAAWLADSRAAFFVAESDAALVGFVIVAMSDGLPGLQPQQLGRVMDMGLDLHQSHPGLGGNLLARAKSWLKGQGIQVMAVDLSARYPVEEAFWRSQGAKLRFHTYWMAI